MRNQHVKGVNDTYRVSHTVQQWRKRQVEHGTDNLCNQLCEEGINQRIEIQRSLELQDSSCKSTRLFLTYIASSFSQQDWNNRGGGQAEVSNRIYPLRGKNTCKLRACIQNLPLVHYFTI